VSKPEDDPLERGMQAAYEPRSVLEQLAEQSGIDTRLRLRPEGDTGPVLKPLAGDESAGKYQLQGEIARGGVGTVFKGFDTHLGRDVAIKLLHEEYLGNPDLLQRFVEEAQIGGQLQHPGIVPVYDLGLKDERPFFSMKLVKGRTLAALLEERENASEGRRRLLAIFEQVCHTMAYAHARAVIHRDLKPANVMVGAFGEVQVVDWGMGKVLGKGGIADEARSRLSAEKSVIATVRSKQDGSQSVVGSVMGTPAYMPPEQAMGDVERMDERSDVFSLGAVLCEILTGKPPYVGDELIQKAAQADLDDCYERLDECDADAALKVLVRQCLSPARQARPKDANALAERIGRHITSVEERAQEARVDAAEERVKAHEAKHAQKLTLGLAASVLLVLVLGGSGFWWLRKDKAARQDKAGRAVTAALDEAREGYGHAKGHHELERWQSAIAVAKRAAALARSEEVAPDLKRDSESHLALVTQGYAEAEQQRARLKRERKTLAILEAVPIPPDDHGDWLVDPKSDMARCDHAYRQAFAAFGLPIEELTAEEAAARIRKLSRPAAWAAALDDWAGAAYSLKNDANHTHLLQVAKAADPDKRRGEFRALRITKKIELAQLRRFIEGARNDPPLTAIMLAVILGARGGHEEAAAVLHAAQQRHPAHFLLALRLAQSRIGLQQLDEGLRFASIAASLRPDNMYAALLKGITLKLMRRYPESERALRKVLRLDPEFASAHKYLGEVLDVQGRRAEALAAFREFVRLGPGTCLTCYASALKRIGRLKEAEKAQREELKRDPKSAMHHNNLGATLNEQSRLEEAGAEFREAIRLDPKLALAHSNLGNVYLQQRKYAEAVEKYKTAIRLDPKFMAPRMRLAVMLQLLKKYPEAAAAARSAIQLEPNHAQAHLELGKALDALDKHHEAIRAYRDAARLEPNGTGALINIGQILLGQEKYSDAVDVLRQAIARNQQDGYAYYWLGRALYRLERYEEAVQAFLQDIRLGPNDRWASSDLSRTHFVLARAYRAMGELDKAIAALQDAVRIDPNYKAAYNNLGLALKGRGRFKEAIDALNKAVALDPKNGSTHANLGLCLALAGKKEEAIAAMRKGIQLGYRPPQAYVELGATLFEHGEREKGIAAIRKALELDPKFADAHYALGVVLRSQGELDKAAESFRRAGRLDPKLATAHYNLGGVLQRQGKYKEAAAAYRAATKAAPEVAEGWCNLGAVLRRLRQYEESLRCYEKGHELGSSRKDWSYDSADWVKGARELATRMPAILAGKLEPRDADEAHLAGSAAYDLQMHLRAVALFAKADTGEVGPQRRYLTRYNGACSAALAAAGQGEDAADLDPQQRSKLRAQALAWLRLELHPKAATDNLKHALGDEDLDSIRDEKELAKLPAAEREAFAALWRGVRKALGKQ